jgi:hypothetical protein
VRKRITRIFQFRARALRVHFQTLDARPAPAG